MIALSALWLPIVLSAMVVFVVSSIIHMATPWHKNDYAKVPNEDKMMESLRAFELAPGDYMMPRPTTMQEMRSPAFVEKRAKGPVMVFTVMPRGPFSMGKNLALWFLYSLVVAIFAAYVASRALPAGAAYPPVFRLVSVTTFIGYAVALWQMSIWYRRSWRTTLRTTIDGFIYALLSAGIFGWLWPH